MRHYAKVAPQFWTGATGKEIRRLGHDVQVVAFYLMTCPSANMIGLYYLPVPTIAHEIGSSIEGASKGLRSLCALGFCEYDADSELVWVREMARFQTGETLKAGDKRIAGVARCLAGVPKSRLHLEFLARYGEAYRLNAPAPTEGASKGLRRGSKGPPKQGSGSGTGSGTDPHTQSAREGSSDIGRTPSPAVGIGREPLPAAVEDWRTAPGDIDRAVAVWEDWRAVCAEVGQPVALTPSAKELVAAVGVVGLELAGSEVVDAMRAVFAPGSAVPAGRRSFSMFAANVGPLVGAARRAQDASSLGGWAQGWDCPHDPHCGARGACERLTALEAAKRAGLGRVQ